MSCWFSRSTLHILSTTELAPAAAMAHYSGHRRFRRAIAGEDSRRLENCNALYKIYQFVAVSRYHMRGHYCYDKITSFCLLLAISMFNLPERWRREEVETLQRISKVYCSSRWHKSHSL
jgi:hypothetical protein